MPTSATGWSRRRPELSVASPRGFSLLELLVVLAILAAVTGLALLASGGGQAERRGAVEMERFALKLELLCDRAVLESRLLGMELTAAGYAATELTGDGWIPLNRDAAFATVQLPSGWTWQFAREGAFADLPKEWPEEPQLLCLPDGRSTPFRLRLGAAGQGWQLRGEGRGRPELTAVEG